MMWNKRIIPLFFFLSAVICTATCGIPNTTVAPRRKDDFVALSDDGVNDEDSATESVHILTPENVLDKKTEPLGAYAVFGVAFRPVFPADDVQVNFTRKKYGPSAPDGTAVPALGVVDVSLAQFAHVNVFSSNDNLTKVNIYASREGLNCSCGKQTNPHRIVNGVAVKINELPWTAALFKKTWLGFWGSKPYCGGTLINTRYIVTASHCVDGMSARSLKVRLNEEDVSKNNENEEGYYEFNVEKIMMHQNYSRRTIDNDIALLKLSKAVDLKEGGIIQPACLPANDIDLDMQIATVAGWGATGQGGSQSTVLRKVDVPIINNYDCNNKTTYTGKITDNMLCAGDLENGGKDSCQGDSGGPLIINNAGRRTLVGIVSWGYGCARPKSPGVYARVSRYGDWVLENTKDAEWCKA